MIRLEGLNHMAGDKKSPDKQKHPNFKSYEMAGGPNSTKTSRSATSACISTKKSASTLAKNLMEICQSDDNPTLTTVEIHNQSASEPSSSVATQIS